ncbi:MAG: DGQHR domain-containing protein [Methanoregula sp.]|jgi:DGQHR domain-containing protein
MICSSCGFEIKGKRHGPYDERYVCEDCWNNPALFFSDKMNDTLEKIAQNDNKKDLDDLSIIEIIDIYRNYPRIKSQNLETTWKNIANVKLKIKVIKIQQKGMPLYIGKIQAKDLLLLATTDQWRDEALDGYQREKFREKTSEIKKYLEGCSISIIPAILASFGNANFVSSEEEIGTLEIPLKPGTISILDGQQRIGGFEEIYKEIKKIQTKHSLPDREELIKKYTELLSFEIPIVFVDSKAIIEKMRKESPNNLSIKQSELEGAFFFIINKTQKPVNPSLKDELAYKTLKAGITGIPIIDKEKWRTEIVPVVNELNKESSPFEGLINLGGTTSNGHPVPLFSFVSSLKPLFDNNKFKELNFDQKKTFLINYWACIREMFPDTFDEKTRKQFLMLRTTSIYAFNYLANDIYSWCLDDEIDPSDIASIKKFLGSLSDFDWDKQTSPFAFLGGGKGVRKAHDVLLNVLSEKGITHAVELIQNQNVIVKRK